MNTIKTKRCVSLIVIFIALVLTATACVSVGGQPLETLTVSTSDRVQPKDTSTTLEESETQGVILLEADLSVPETVPLCTPIELEFKVTNKSDQAVYLLTWYTPLEGVLGDIFQITYEGQERSYLGPMVMRAAPLAEQYVMLEPGGSATAVVDVSTAYDFTRVGHYTIAFQSPQISHAVDDPSEFADSVDELGPVQLSSRPVEVEIVPPADGGGDCAPSTGSPPTDPGQGKEPDRTLTGIVKDVSPSARIIWLKEEVDGFTTIALTADGTVSTASGKSLRLNQIQQGLTVRASGWPGENQALLAHEVQVVPPKEK